ncbi:MAG TPA: endopeptidase La [Candidatus Dormibacteraeota bacterium]|jgi:ATP-dependent Lon protease|nr:endopeptidase La [Candidatus Dormibacteraeota bacterium]
MPDVEPPAPAADPESAAARPGSLTLPAVPLRDNVVFPSQLAPLAAGRPRSVAALEAAVNGDGRVVLAIQRDAERDDASIDDVHSIAVIAHVGAFRRLPGGGAHALVEGKERVRIEAFDASGDEWIATVTPVPLEAVEGTEVDALFGSVRTLFADYVNAGAQVGADTAVAMARASQPELIADIASTCPDFGFDDRVALLQETDTIARLRTLIPLLAREVEVAQLRSKIHEDVQKTINNSQREHILREQLRAIRKELTELDDAGEDDEDLAARVEKAGMPDNVKQRVLKEVHRLEQIPSASPEMGMVRTWVDWLLDLPWVDPPAETLDIERAATILDEDHYGLTKVKDRVLEWLAVRERIRAKDTAEQAAAENAQDKVSETVTMATEEAGGGAGGSADRRPGKPQDDQETQDGSDPAGERRGVPAPTGRAAHRTGPKRRTLQTPILCFVGPPGVGKTSLGRSIARALDRKFVRMSLGGIRDEAEIRGHRRTYIGALPGRIIQSMRTAGTRNAVIMLDEIDKVGADFRGDPSAALLEVLDPEQNWEFSDHYLEVPYDLSQVLFITTANIAETISPPLRDRMEIIRITGYTEQEKVQIAERHLVPRQLDQHSLDADELQIPRETIVAMLHGYTREAGVRQLDRTIAEIARKVPRKLAAGATPPVVITPDELSDLLGPRRHDYGEAQEQDEIGAVTGVVVSEVGGDIITVEALAIETKADLVLTGQLGSVMEESARAALSWAKVHAVEYGAPRDFFDTHAIHVHVPAGAIPKDGPSAGVTMATAMVSVASSRRVRRDLAMTGEVTLRGKVLPIGGVKDKLLAAHRSGLKTFILPAKNLRDLYEVDKEILDAIEVVPVDNVGEVLDRALVESDAPRRRERRGAGFVLPITAADVIGPINAGPA